MDSINKFDEVHHEKLSEHDIKNGDEIGSDNYLSDGIPFIKTSDFLNFGIDFQPNYYCSEAMYEELEQDLHKGDILFTKDGKIGEIAIIEDSIKFVISSGVVRIRPASDEERYWLFLLLSSNYGRMFFTKWTVVASTMAHLRKDFFKDFKIPQINESTKRMFLEELKIAFRMKKEAQKEIESSKKTIVCELLKNVDV